MLGNTVGQILEKFEYGHRDPQATRAWIAEAPAGGVLAASTRLARRPALRSSGKR